MPQVRFTTYGVFRLWGIAPYTAITTFWVGRFSDCGRYGQVAGGRWQVGQGTGTTPPISI